MYPDWSLLVNTVQTTKRFCRKLSCYHTSIILDYSRCSLLNSIPEQVTQQRPRGLRHLLVVSGPLFCTCSQSRGNWRSFVSTLSRLNHPTLPNSSNYEFPSIITPCRSLEHRPSSWASLQLSLMVTILERNPPCALVLQACSWT